MAKAKKKTAAHRAKPSASKSVATAGKRKLPRTQTAADVLREAAALIERDGWWDGKGMYLPKDGRHCALMAIGECERNNRLATSAEHHLSRYLGVDWLADWNDSRRSGTSVIAALRACAASLEA
jgi:hypothetical protein